MAADTCGNSSRFVRNVQGVAFRDVLPDLPGVLSLVPGALIRCAGSSPAEGGRGGRFRSSSPLLSGNVSLLHPPTQKTRPLWPLGFPRGFFSGCDPSAPLRASAGLFCSGRRNIRPFVVSSCLACSSLSLLCLCRGPPLVCLCCSFLESMGPVPGYLFAAVFLRERGPAPFLLSCL